MAKVGAAAAVKKKNTTQSAPVQSAPVTPVPAAPVRTGTAMTPQNVVVQAPTPATPTISVQANPLPVSEEQHYVNQLKDQLIRQQALEYLQQRRANSPTGNLKLDQAKAVAQRDQARHLNNKVIEDNKRHMAALTKEDALAKRNYTNQYTDFRKDAEKASTKDVLNWLADYKAYRDSGSWDDTLRTSLATRYQTLYDNAQKYARFGEDGNYLDYKGLQTKANPLDTMTAAYKTLEGPQVLKDVYGTEDYRKNPYEYFPNWQAKSDTLLNQGASLDTYGYDRNDFITPLEAQNYEWLYENKGEKAAEEYRKSLNTKNDASYANWLEEKFNPGYAAEHPVAASVTSVLGTYGAPLAFLENTIATAKGEDINPNSWANAVANQRTQLRNEVSKNIDSNAGRFLYNTGMSIGDNLALMPLNALGGAGEMAMLGTLGASAANDRTRELMSQGASSQEAYIRGLVSGAIEAITEKVSLDKLLTTSWKGGAANFFKNMGIQGLIEGSEEGASNLLNLAADTITAVVKHEGVGPLEKEIQELEKKGVSRSEATSQVILGHLKDLGLDVAGGALSGAVMGGGYSAFNYNNLVNAGTNIVTNEDGTLKMDVVERLVTRGHNMPADTISHRQADLLQQKINEGKAVTAREAAVLYANNTSAEQNMPYNELLKLRKKEIDPGEWQAAKDEAMEHAEEFNKDVRKLYERTVEEAVTNGATGQQAAAEFDRAYTSGFNRLQAPQTQHLSENTVREIMQAAQTERTGTQPRRMAASRANAERNLDSVNNYAENGSKVYQVAVREALDNGATEEQARVAFNEVYSNVYANKPIPTNTSIPLSAPTIANIREAALKDRFAAENKARADAIPVNTNAGVAISDPVIRQHVEQGRLVETVNLLDELGKRFGVKISLVAKLPQNGQINLRTGEIVVALNTDFGGFIDRDQAVRATLGHELAHRMRQASPKTWDKFTQAVIGTNIDHFNADVNKMIKDTYKGDITRDAAQEEVLADYIGSWFFSGDVDSLRTMAEAIDSLPQRSGFIQHIVDIASWIKSKLTGKPASNAQRIEDEFRKMFKETQAKVQQAEAAKVVPLSSEEAAHQNLVGESDVKYSRKSSAVDSEGRTLTSAQAEFFKDSKIRDENGNLLVMYHGTPESFTVFDPVKFGGKNGNAEGFGIYLSDSKEIMSQYGAENGITAYVNITHPAYTDRKTITKPQLKKVIQAICEAEAERMVAEDEYGSKAEALKDTWISNYTYTYDKSISQAYTEVADSIYAMNENDTDIIGELINGTGSSSYEHAYELYDILTPITGIDGISTVWHGENGESARIAVAFNSNQIKNITNQTPTQDPDIRYSRRDSEGRTLTPEQAKFFADSKARDANGNLLVLYHGTVSAGFNTFRNEIWMTTSRKDAGSYGAATRTYDPNEQRVDVATKGGNFTIGSSLRFDTEQDRADFLKEYPEAINYLTPREMMAAQRTADEEEDYDRYDELVDQEKTDEKIRRAYSRYEDQHSETIPLKELVDNKDQYTVDDFKRALLSIDRNAYFDDEYDNYETDEEFRDAIAEVLEESFLNEDESYNDFPVRVRIPAGKNSTAADVTHIHNRIYEMYANVTHPYTYDAKGRGSEGNGAYYAAVQKALDSDEYDGAIINNIRVGRYQELGTVVVAKDPSQVKLVSNQNPSSDPDIRYSRKSSDAEYMAAVNEGNMRAAQRMVDAAAKKAGYDIKAYHGTTEDFNTFSRTGQGRNHDGYLEYGAGFYFTPNADEAREWVRRGRSGQSGKTDPRVMSVYLKANSIINEDAPMPNGAEYLQMMGLGKADANFVASRTYRFINYLLEDKGFSNIEVQETLKSFGIDAIEATYGKHTGKLSGQYVVFDPEQIKSADPVTYDDNGNVIPLSERFNEDTSDIRYSKRSSSSKDAVIRRQQETIDRLRHEMVETHGVEPDPKAIADAAVQFGRDWNSTMPETEIKDAFADIAKEFATYRRLNNQGADPNLIRSVEQRFEDKCTELANKVVKSAAMLVGDNARAQELKQFVWKHPIQNDPSFKKEFGEFPALREAIKGKIKLAKDGMPISRLYESLNEQFSDYPLFQEWEGETLEPVDMLLDLLDLINDFDKAYNPYTTADAVDTVAAEIMNTIFDAPVSRPTFADRKAAEVEAAKAETARVREQARKQTPADIKAYYEAKLNDIKEQRDRYLADLVQAYKDRSARAKESEERARLLRIMKRLDRLAKKSSDARRAEIKDIVGNFDLISQRISNHKAQELTELADWVRRNKDNADTIITPQIADKLARLDKQHISDLTIGDVRAITEALLEIEHRIRTENRIIGLNERRNTVDIGKQIIQDVRNAPGAGSSALARGMDKFLINGLMRPETEFLRLVGFNKNSPLYEYTFGDKLSLLTGQKTMQDYQRQAHEDYFRKFLDDKEFMKSITGKNARTIEITGTDEQGKEHTVKVTPDFVMAMYMHSRNVQNLMHIVNYTDEFGREVKAGGMTVPDYKLYKDGKKTEAYNAGTKLTFTRSQFENQLKGLTPKEMEFIKAAQRYYSEMSQPRINDVSEQLLGYSLAKVDNYFRINTDPDYRGGDMENLRFDGTIEGMGWTKERVNGKNPILLIPLSEQLQKDIVAHSKYVGMAIPIRNFSKIYGVNENTYSQNADGKWELQNAYASSVIKEINKKHPSGADTNYIRDLLADIQNPSSNMSALDKVFAALRSKYAGSVLTLNLGVALKQAASFPTAAAEIGWGPILKTVPQFVKAMGGFAKPMNQKTIDFISKYSPLMRLRTQGMSTQELADMQRLNHKIPGVLNWIQNVDVGTVAALWKASEEYVKQNFKDLKPGSEEFYQKVGDVHTRVITKTQPNYSELQRPGLLRSKSEITKTLMMFKTQPFQNFNILYEAVGSFKAAERAYKANPSEENKAGRDEARKRLAWAVSSQVVSNSVFAAMQVIWDIMRRKEDPLDDEDKNVQRMNNFFKNMISSWAGMVPGGTQALEIVEKWVDDALVAMEKDKYFDAKVYGFELDASIEGLNKLVDLITNIPNLGGDIFGLIKGGDNKEGNIRDLFKQFQDISTFLGIPANNVMNITHATMEWAMTKGLGYSDVEARYLADRYIYGVDNKHSSSYYSKLAAAAGGEVMQMFLDDPMILESAKKDAKKAKFENEFGPWEIHLDDMGSVTEEAFKEFAQKYAQTNDGNGNITQVEIAAALGDTGLDKDVREAIYNLYKDKKEWSKTYDEATAKAAKADETASTAETATKTTGQTGSVLTSLTTPGVNALMPGTVNKSRVEITTPPEIWMDVPAEMKDAYRMFAESYSAGSDGDGKVSQAEAIHALGDVDEANREALYNLLADGKWTSSYHDAKVAVDKDDMQQTYGTNEMYLENIPVTGDRLDEFNRAYAAVSNNNDSVTQAELAAALNSMNVSLEEGEAIWAAYAQDHADKYGSAWKKTYASYYGGGSGGSSGGGKSSGGGGGRSSGGGGSRSSGGSTQPVVGPYPGYSENPAATYQPAAQSVQPVAMPQPVATAPQTPYTGLQRHSEGGNVDLTYRPILRAVELRRKGWGGVLNDTVRNFVKSYAGNGKALNFTPIVLDEDGKYVRTLSPNELREYAEAVLKGEREDDLKLQVGTAYEGADAMAQAEKAAAEIAQLDKDYTQTA